MTTRYPERREFSKRLLRWAKTHGRNFFWRAPGISPFQILVTEVLLTRTRADAVETIAKKLLRSYPDVVSLAHASEKEIQKIIYPLGMFRKRARGLIACANALLG